MKDSILHLRSAYESWRKELKSLRTDIRVLRNKLEDIVVRKLNTDLLAQVDHFENKFNILETHVRNLMHDVKSVDRVLVDQADQLPKQSAAAVAVANADSDLEEKIFIISKDFYETKNDYKRFLSLVR